MESVFIAEEKITLPIMTIYEKTSVIKERSKQIENGYKTTIPDEVKEKRLTSSIDIAMMEFDLGKMPDFTISRKRGDGLTEIWTKNDFLFSAN